MKSRNMGRVGGYTRLCLSTLVDKPHGAKHGGGNAEDMGGVVAASRVQSASHAGPCTWATTGAREDCVLFYHFVANVTEEGQTRTINLCKQCYNVTR